MSYIHLGSAERSPSGKATDRRRRVGGAFAVDDYPETLLVKIGVVSMLDIIENSVSAVLLNDGWHHPINGTFKIDDIRLHAETSAGIDFGKVCALWDEDSAAANATVTMTAPLASILAFQRKK